MSRFDGVVNGIKRMIIEGELRPGERLPVEKNLADLLKVSRSTLREGIRALSTLGILQTRQGDGTYVTALEASRLLAPLGFIADLHGRQAQYVHAVRQLLESEAARLAAGSITSEDLAATKDLLDQAAWVLEESPEDRDRLVELDIAFHMVIAAGSGNPVLAGMIKALVSRGVCERIWSRHREVDVEQRTHHEHMAIWRALESRDTDAARVRMANHLFGEGEALRDIGRDQG
jgi:DNA-binding FadR family transcriptional regulator